MARRKIVVALGEMRYSLEKLLRERARSIGKTAEQLVKIMENDVDIVIAHGNGPQVGNILLQQKRRNGKDTCNAIRYLWGNESRNDWILDGKCD